LDHGVATFVTLTLGLSYAAYLLPIPPEAKAVLFPMVIVFIPVLVATVLAAVGQGSAGLSALYRYLRPNKPRWLLIGALVGVTLQLAIAVLALLLGMVPSVAINTSPAIIVIAILAPLFALGEEIGWRGYVLPRLLVAHNPLAASLIGGIPWALVHLALFLPGMMYGGRPVVAQIVPIVFFSILFTWAFLRSGSSVLAPTMLHGAFNSLGVLLTSSLTAEQATYLGGSVLTIAALVVVAARPSFWLRAWPESKPGTESLPEALG
jgi:membrane protease YdiL (CAAX protease family)